MVAWPKPALPLLLAAALLAFEDWLSTPSCSGGPPAAHGPGELRAMMVADLMLLGSDATYADRFFRDHVMHKFFANSIQTLKPDMIVVLGDISAKGSEFTERKWISVIEQFEGILGHHSSLPRLIALGDKDVGSCANLEGKFVHHKAKHLPGLDSCGCGAFEISNVSFVSLNAVALLCDNNDLRFGVEKFMERESHHFQRLNKTECYPLALKPRIIFNAHTGSFSDFLHADGTREITVPAMTWKTRGVPGFVISTFDTKGSVTLRYCWLAQEWHVIMGYLAFVCLTALAVKLSR
ncbi:hypothetical protein HU200_021447 [Digitaria exilis]|uniref:Metallophosphoesterase 1 n=1 Tax=Digitaria exilis TaxID=1010633 RepID=A0A835K8U9_9POAL|nr:hypothetical protein HU200_021447 [Digitaria exilis]